VAEDKKPNRSQQGIKSVEVGSRVLLALEQGKGPQNLSDVARRSGLHPAKAHRYLTSLTRTGLASQDASTGKYSLGPATRHLGIEALRQVDPVRTASSYSIRLRDETGHTSEVAVWSNTGPTLVVWDTGAHSLPIVVRVGSTLPLLDSAVGYVALAYLPESMTTPVLKDQQQLGSTRKIPAAGIREIKQEVLENGYGSTRNRMIFGLAALAAPVFGATGQMEIALGLVLPVGMLSAGETRRLGKILRGTADQASEELGFNG
jgi:DNA-binding IclR family transcriptional regulator